MTFAEHLAAFNRKERFWLLKDALGEGAANLSASFLEKFGAHKRPSPLAWWAMDYHFDWIIAALWQAGREVRQLGPTEKATFAAAIRGNEEDVDLLIAEGRRVWLCEAKFSGVLSTGQIDSKSKRTKTLRDLSEIAGVSLDLIEVDALPKGRGARRKDRIRTKDTEIEIDAHLGVDFLRLIRTDFDRSTCRDFEIEPIKI